LFLMYSILWGFVINTMKALIILLIGFSLGVKCSINWASTTILVLLLLLSTIGLAMTSAGFIVKQGNPISVSHLYYFNHWSSFSPVIVLLGPAKMTSYALPLTWTPNGLWLAMLQNYEFCNSLITSGNFHSNITPTGVCYFIRI